MSQVEWSHWDPSDMDGQAEGQESGEQMLFRNAGSLSKAFGVGFIDWLDDGTQTMGAAEALDGNAEWNEALASVSICQCTGSESVWALGLPQKCRVPRCREHLNWRRLPLQQGLRR